MRAVEFVVEARLDEGLKHNLAMATLLGLSTLSNSTINPDVTPTIGNISQPELKSLASASKKSGASKQAIEHALELLKNPKAKTLYDAAIKTNIRGDELAQLMAQAAHETMNFYTLREMGDKNYFLKSKLAVFGI
jgi:hypothetical protein